MATTKGSRLQYQCSFCAKSQDQVKKLIAGPGAVIQRPAASRARSGFR